MTEYEKICSFQNLYKAHIKCRRNKRHKPEVIRFEMNLAENLTSMSEALKSRTYRMQGYYHFTIYEPKKREVFAAHYADRVLLHCICDEVLASSIGPRLIYDNAACQVGKGTHFALDRMSDFLRRHYRQHGNNGYVLKCDISKYFSNIDHEILKEQLTKAIRDRDVLRLLYHFIDSYHTPDQIGTGIPLGNQSSQWFGLYYLDPLDRLIKEKFQVKSYVRYMDDFLLVHPDKQFLRECLNTIRGFVKEALNLELNEKTQLYTLKDGFEFLGWKFILTDTGKVVRRLKKQSKQRFKRRLKQIQQEYATGTMTLEEAKAVLASYNGHLSHGHTYQMQKKVYHDFLLKKNGNR